MFNRCLKINNSLQECCFYFTSECEFLSAHMHVGLYISWCVSAHSVKGWKEKISIWQMGIYSPAGNTQISDAFFVHWKTEHESVTEIFPKSMDLTYKRLNYVLLDTCGNAELPF